MNPTGKSHFNQARIEWAIRLKYSPLPELDMQLLGGQLNQFRIGELRQIGKTWEVMMERDAELAVNSDKRKSDASGMEWQVVSDGSLVGDLHAGALTYFYENATTSKALDQDATGGTDELVYQLMSAVDYYYSVSEMLLRVDNPAAKEVTCEFRQTPIWFFESRRGYLGYLQHIFDLYGQPLIAGEWLSAVNVGWMRPLTMAYAAKWFAMTDWLVFCRRYGSGFLEGITEAQAGSTEWEQAIEAMRSMGDDGSVLHNRGLELKFLDQEAKNQLPFEPVIETIDRLYAKCYRGMDMATSSRGSRSAAGGAEGGAGPRNATGASVQKEESGIFLLRDAKWCTGVFNERIDRPIIRYLFGQEPRAWFALIPPLDDTTDADLNSLKTLVPMGLQVALKEVYKRFRWSVPEPGEPCLNAPVQAMQPGQDDMNGTDEADETDGAAGKNGAAKNGHGGGAAEALRQRRNGTAAVLPGPVLPDEKPKVDDGRTQTALTEEDTPIGFGADPKRWQAASGLLPDTQVDASNFWSRVGTAPRGADGQILPMPSLGYALPNADRLENLMKRGLGNSRAAQSLRREIKRASSIEVALANEGEVAATRVATAMSDLVGHFKALQKRMRDIAKIPDVELQKEKVAELFGEVKRLQASPGLAKSLAKILTMSFEKGAKAEMQKA